MHVVQEISANAKVSARQVNAQKLCLLKCDRWAWQT